MKLTPAYEDTDLMIFGKFKGKPLSDVPSSYLAWLRDTWENEGAPGNLSDTRLKLYNYICNSWDAIKMDLKDRV